MKIREVHTGGASGGSYVVLQMYSGGQNFVGGHKIVVYGAGGAQVHTFTFPSHVGNGANQATILVAGNGYATAFPSGPAPDESDASLDIPAASGAVCFESIDCVSWGTFSWGANPQPSPTGTPASPTGVTAGKALRRTISAGSCTNQLDSADDTNDSAADFTEQAPHPRSNSSPIEEGATCTPPTTPDTAITSASVPASPARTKSTEAEFSFVADPPDPETTFECSLDSGVFTACTSPESYTGLVGGAGTTHTFRVRAVHPTDGTDGTPASHTWIVDTVAPTATILTQPADHSPETSASFTYQSSEVGSTFECSLAVAGEAGEFKPCGLGGETYEGLADMTTYVFEVCATDKAGNKGDPEKADECDEHEWTVDSSAADTTPPQTTITSMPPNPSESSTASFTYSSNEPGSTFECKLDATGFVGCPATGITYTGLANGTHAFQVRAKDPSGNIDPTPAGYTFDVVALISDPLPPPPPPPPPEPEPGTASAAGVAQVKGASVLLAMRCRGQQGARCEGNLRLLARVGAARSSRRAVRKLMTIARGRYNLPAGGRSRIVRVRLTPQGRRLVRRAGKRGLRVRLAGTGLKSRALTLRAGGG